MAKMVRRKLPAPLMSIVVLGAAACKGSALRNGTATDPVRIMPLGDDMTYGCGENS